MFRRQLQRLIEKHSGDPRLSAYVAAFCEHWFTTRVQHFIFEKTPSGQYELKKAPASEFFLTTGLFPLEPETSAFFETETKKDLAPYIEKYQGIKVMTDADEPDLVQEAFHAGYPEFVDAPLRRVESSWSSIGASLKRMEEKLEGITR